MPANPTPSPSAVEPAGENAHDPGGKRKLPWPSDSRIQSRFSECGRYRYWLAETWDEDLPVIAWLMMNPSVASLDYSDPTLAKTGRFSRQWGYGQQRVANVHAYRMTDSRGLAAVSDPVGPENDLAILRACASASVVVLAYGKPPKPLRPRAERVVKMLADAGLELMYLRLSNDGTPYHPLYLPGDSRLIPYTPTEGKR